MKTYVITIAMLSIALSSCDDAPKVAGPLVPPTTTQPIEELETFDVRDIFDGHPYFWYYFPFEEQLSVDTLKATNFLFTAAYSDTIGWGGTHPSHKLYDIWGWAYPTFRLIVPFRRSRTNLDGSNPFGWYAGRFSRTTNGVLEFGELGGYTDRWHSTPTFIRALEKNSYSLNYPEAISYDFTLEYSDTATRDLQDFNLNLGYWSAFGRHGLPRPPSSYPLPFDSSYAGKYVQFGALPSAIHIPNARAGSEAPISDLYVYMPEVLRVKPIGRPIEQIEHSRHEPIHLEWEGDRGNSNDSILIIVTNYHRNSVSFSHGTQDYPRKQWHHPQSNWVGVAFMGANNNPQFPNLWWADNADELHRGGVPTKWHTIVHERQGTNRFTIPASVFAQAVSGEYFDIRCYRWNNMVRYVDSYWRVNGLRETWVVGKGASERRQVRVQAKIISQSIGRVQITD